MNHPQLRIYDGGNRETEQVIEAATHSPQAVTVSLSDVFPLLADAVQNDRTWLQDFADDEVTISADLYDVIMAYQHFHRPSA